MGSIPNKPLIDLKEFFSYCASKKIILLQILIRIVN